VQQAADIGGLSVPAIEGFLRTGEETWDGAASGRFKQDGIYSDRAKACHSPKLRPHPCHHAAARS